MGGLRRPQVSVKRPGKVLSECVSLTCQGPNASDLQKGKGSSLRLRGVTVLWPHSITDSVDKDKGCQLQLPPPWCHSLQFTTDVLTDNLPQCYSTTPSENTGPSFSEHVCPFFIPSLLQPGFQDQVMQETTVFCI